MECRLKYIWFVFVILIDGLHVATESVFEAKKRLVDSFPKLKNKFYKLDERLTVLENLLKESDVNLLNQTCINHAECGIINSRCNSEKCFCDFRYYYTKKTHRCHKSADLLTFACDSDVSCAAITDNSICLNYKCACVGGYSYDITSDKCLESCSVWGRSFSQEFKGYGVHGHSDATYTSVETAQDCMQMCAYEALFPCKVVEFTNNVCYLTELSWSELPEQAKITQDTSTGTTAFFRQCGDASIPLRRHCTTTADCPTSNFYCRNKECVCDKGYCFNMATGSCVKVCQEYGSTYSGFYNTGVKGCNLLHAYVSNPQQCIDMCTASAGFVCKNVEYQRSTNLCYFCNKTWYELPWNHRLQNDVGWTTYFRNCI